MFTIYPDATATKHKIIILKKIFPFFLIADLLKHLVVNLACTGLILKLLEESSLLEYKGSEE